MITARHVITGPVGATIRNGAVLIDGDIITAVGPRHEIEQQVTGDVYRRDYPRHTLLPGLINCHVHLAFDASPTPVGNLMGAEDTDLLLGMAGRAQTAVRSGVTTVRDLGDRGGLAVRLKQAITRGDFIGPRIVAAGPPLTIQQGHCWFFGGEVDGEATIRQQIQHNAALGVDCIKVMASGGQLTPSSPPMWQSQFSTQQLRIIVDEARRAGLPVAAHAHGTDAISSATEAGVTTIEHCTWMRSGGGGLDPRDDVAKQMAQRGIYACIAWPPRWEAFMQRLGPERAGQVVQRFHWLDEIGVPLITGTDAGLPHSTFDGFIDALHLYGHVGFAPERIIEMATVTSAAALGLDNYVGQLAAGYSADLLVVEGDPLNELAALHRQTLVLAQGREIHNVALTD